MENKNIDNKSEEVQDIIDRMPTGWARYIIVTFTGIIIIMLVLSFTIEYSDTVNGEINITGNIAPVKMVSQSAGRIRLIKEDNAYVKKGEVLAYIETGAQYNDMQILSKICKYKLNPETILDLPSELVLGSMNPAYNDFVLAYNNYDKLRKTKVYENLRMSLRNQQKANVGVYNNVQNEIEIMKQLFDIQKEQFSKDSLLFSAGAISQIEYENKKAKLMEFQKSMVELNSMRMSKNAEISSTALELAKVDVNVSEDLRASFNTLVLKFNALCNEEKQWREKYLLIAPSDGILEYIGFWRENDFIKIAEDLFSIVPKQNHLVGEMTISSYGAGKVKKGQNVLIQLNDFPYAEFGHINGVVSTITEVSHEQTINGNNISCYRVKIDLPNDIKSNYNQLLTINYETKGMGKIITTPHTLIERLFDNLNSIRKN